MIELDKNWKYEWMNKTNKKTQKKTAPFVVLVTYFPFVSGNAVFNTCHLYAAFCVVEKRQVKQEALDRPFSLITRCML